MRIAHLVSTFFPSMGGAEVCVHNLASEQTKEGHIVKVIAPIKDRTKHFEYETLPLRKMSVSAAMLPIFDTVYFVSQIAGYQRRYRFDIWQVTIGYPFGVAVLGFFKKNNIPCVLRCSGEDIQREPSIGYGVRRYVWPDLLIRRSYPRFDALISITESITQEYLKIGVAREKIYHIPNGVDKTFFDILLDYNYNIEDLFGIDPGKKLIVSVGRNHPKKGFNIIPDIIRILLRRRNDFVWLLVGKGNERIAALARRRGVGKFLIVKENFPHKELAALYKNADLFVLPTLIEGCSNVVAEAMASSLPVVSTKAEGIEDMVEDGRTGILSQKNDADDMAGKIELALNDERLRTKIRKNALEKTKSLDWQNVAGRYLAVYEKIRREKG